MSQHIVIIGAGPAGESAARTVRQLGPSSPLQNGAPLEITLIEKEQPGGLCLNKGCIPSKTLLENVHQLSLSGQPIDWEKLQEIKNQVVSGIRTQLQNTLQRSKINYVQGAAAFKNQSQIQVQTNTGPKEFSFDKAIITTGTDIFYPPPLDKFKDQILNSDKILNLTKMPESIVIVGGGAVGLEFACLLNAAGSKVSVVELQKGILPGEDPAVVSALTRLFEARGILFKTETSVTNLEKTKTGWKTHLSSGEAIESHDVLACVGRIPVPSQLNLENAGIKTDKNRLTINQHLQTTNPNIFAAGDTTTTKLAHAASAQAEVAAANAIGIPKTFDDQLTPRCLYTWPEVASVGAWKYQRDEKNLPVKTSRAFFKGSARALAAGETDGFVQVVSDPESKSLLGAQIIGAHATELIHIFSVALKAKMTTEELGQVMFAHPTLAESIKEACKK